MAKGDRTAGIINAEELHAQRIVDLHNLVPPVDIDALVQDIADLEEDHIPVAADALFIDLPTRARPLIIIRAGMPSNRRRFTLAHEYGHYAIPWHIGTLVCHVNGHEGYENYLYRGIEAEADRFASELLMPRGWLEQTVRQYDSFECIYHATLAAGVSKTAAGIALCRVLPPGCIFAEATSNGTIAASAKSPGTAASPPDRALPLDQDLYAGIAQHEVFGSAASTAHWWIFSPDAREVAVQEELPAKLLQDFLAPLDLGENARRKLTMSINGVIGAANHRDATTREELYSRFLQRFASRPDLRYYLARPGFRSFLASKARELIQRRVPSDGR